MSYAKQTDRVLARLQQGPLTQFEAFEELAVWRLAARVNDLKKAGYNIIPTRIDVFNRYGEKCSIAQYQLHEA